VVRRLVGYDRYDSPEALARLNALYEDPRLYVDFLQPSMKLVAKQRVDSKLRKRCDAAQTPYQRVLRSSAVTMRTETTCARPTPLSIPSPYGGASMRA
jgi:hypothetical protein